MLSVLFVGSLPKSVAEFVGRIREHIHGESLVGLAVGVASSVVMQWLFCQGWLANVLLWWWVWWFADGGCGQQYVC